MKIKNLHNYYNNGWYFDIVFGDDINSVRTYITNDDGRGLFLCSFNGDLIQQAGTMQFKLSKNKKYNYKKIRKYFEFYEKSGLI